MSLSTTKCDSGHQLHAEIRLPGPLDQVFEFFSDAYNLQDITPKYLSFEILTPRPVEMKAGALIDYRLQLRGIPIRWRTKISVWEPPYRFVDEQIRGPYKTWHHEHTFEDLGEETLVRDKVHYVSPLAFITHPLMVTRDVRKIFEYRGHRLREIFAASRSEKVRG